MKRITLTAALLLASPAAMACNTLEHQVGWLAREFGERPMIRAASTDGHVLVLFGNPETRSWTTLRVNSTSNACIDDFGNDLSIVGAGSAKR